MKFVTISLSLLAVWLILTGFLFAGKIENPRFEPTAKEPGFALLELFTSEGCSSCPPADELMGKISQHSGDQPVYVLTYHVDYWDNNGWKDIFSNAAFTERQYNYSQRFAGQVYTPQLIVNGKMEFVGSDAVAADAAIVKALNTPAASTLSFSATRTSDSLKITYDVKNDFKRSRLMIAVVQKYAMHNVNGGENKGRALSHWQIVRALHSFAINSRIGREVAIQLPEGFNNQDWEVIGFLQNGKDGAILAANRVPMAAGSKD